MRPIKSYVVVVQGGRGPRGPPMPFNGPPQGAYGPAAGGMYGPNPGRFPRGGRAMRGRGEPIRGRMGPGPMGRGPRPHGAPPPPPPQVRGMCPIIGEARKSNHCYCGKFKAFSPVSTLIIDSLRSMHWVKQVMQFHALMHMLNAGRTHARRWPCAISCGTRPGGQSAHDRHAGCS